MYECFHCGEKAVFWNGDFDFEDYGEEGEGIIHECQCSNCGAHITYRVPIEPKEETSEQIIKVAEFEKHMNNMMDRAKAEGRSAAEITMYKCAIELVKIYANTFKETKNS